MIKNFKIIGVGLDTSGMIYSPSSDELYEYYNYIHTSISENNDYLISDFVKKQSGAPLITTINFTDKMTKAILGHLITLGRDKIDLLLIDSNANWDSPEILQLIDQKIIDNIGISFPSSLDRLIEIKEKYKDIIKFVSIPICPLNFNYDIINWCNENKLDILSFNPFGGKINSFNVISSFTAPYLLGFSATYASIVFLSGNNLFYSNEEFKYLNNLIGKEVEPKYILKKNVSRLHKPFKKVISESLSINDNLVIPINNPDLIYFQDEIKFSLKEPIEIIQKEEDNSSESLKEILHFLNTREDFSEDASESDLFAMNRYDVTNFININFSSSDGWVIENRKLGDLLMVTTVSREVKKGKWINKKKYTESKTFIMGMIGKNRKTFYITEV